MSKNAPFAKYAFLMIFGITCVMGTVAHAADAGKLIATAKQSVRRQLKDPDSANFKAVTVRYGVGEDKHSVVCGRVNSKNSYGGYSGFSRFMWSPTVADAILEEGFPDSAFFESTWQSACGETSAT